MEKNILVISSSLRNKSNSEILADKLICGAKETGQFSALKKHGLQEAYWRIYIWK